MLGSGLQVQVFGVCNRIGPSQPQAYLGKVWIGPSGTGLRRATSGSWPRASAHGCKVQTTHFLCCTSSNHEGCLAAIDRNRRRIVDLPGQFPKLVQRPDTVRSSLPSAPHPVTWPVCRKRTAVPDPNRMHMQALDDCARHFRVPSDFCVRRHVSVQLFSSAVPVFLCLLHL